MTTQVSPGSLLVHVDPRTLEIGLQPTTGTVPLELSAATLNALDRSTEGLASTTKDGVTTLETQGRFRGVWLAVTDASGAVKSFCLTSLPTPVAAAARALKARGGRK